MTILAHTVLFSSFPPHTKYWRRAVQDSLCVAGWSPGLVWSAPAGWRAGAQEETSLVGHSARANPPLSAAFPPPPRILRVGLDTSAPQQPYLIERYSGCCPLTWSLPHHAWATPSRRSYPLTGRTFHVDTESLMRTISVMIYLGSIGLYDRLELRTKW